MMCAIHPKPKCQTSLIVRLPYQKNAEIERIDFVSELIFWIGLVIFATGAVNFTRRHK